jgi:hypothetical protein
MLGAQDQTARGEVSQLVLLSGVEVCERGSGPVKSAEIGLVPQREYHGNSGKSLVNASFARAFLKVREGELSGKAPYRVFALRRFSSRPHPMADDRVCQTPGGL